MNLQPGMVLDAEFELVRPLGEGGMGVVWLAHERSLNREVALKVMRPAESASRILRFQREAVALAALDNPSILPILRTGTDSATGLHYLATRPVLLSPAEIRRLCDEVFLCPYPRDSWEDAGGDTPRSLPLSALLDGGKALPEAAVLRIARDLADALAAAHTAGILHRDLKPSNILFDATGRALLADFGLAKFLPSPGGTGVSPDYLDSISLDETGHRKFLGSPAYAAPETFRDGGAASPALDWYSFGAVLYEALSGERPRSLRKPSSYDPAHISRAWDSFLAALLDPDPARRLSDPAAILRALDRIARHPANGRRHRWLWLGASLGFLGILGTLGILGHLGFLDGRSPETSGQPPALQNLEPAVLQPPRLSSIWQGDDRGPLQLLNTFRQDPVDRVVDEALAQADPEFRRLLQEGDAAWAASPRDVAAANKAYYTAAVLLRDAMAAESGGASPPGEPPPPSVRVCRAVALARLSWTYVVSEAHGAADVPYKEALGLLDPLVEADADRYGPLRSWLLAERAYMECMEDRFLEAAADLREAGTLWTLHVFPQNDPGFRMQSAVLMASFGAMLGKSGNTVNAIEATNFAIDDIAPLLPDYSDTLSDFLAGCHYRLGEIHKSLNNRLESLQSYRHAIDILDAKYRDRGEPYRLAYAQVLGRIARAQADLREFQEAISLWEKMRGLLQPLVESDPVQYKPIVAGILRNCAVAYRSLGDETRAAAAEAEAKAIAEVP